MAPTLFNLYNSDMPASWGCKFGYADYLALAEEDKNMEVLDCLLTEDLKTLGKFFADWRLTPSVSKTFPS